MTKKSMPSSSSSACCTRLAPLDIVGEIVRILRLYDPDRCWGSMSTSADAADDDDDDEQSSYSRAVSALSCDDAARLFLVALSLISRQLDVLDDTAATELHHHHHHHHWDCDQRRQVLLDLLVSLWAAAIAANTR